jgi:hypothetical protein
MPWDLIKTRHWQALESTYNLKTPIARNALCQSKKSGRNQTTMINTESQKLDFSELYLGLL